MRTIKTKEKSNKDIVQQHISYHKNFIKESIQTLQDNLNTSVEYSYFGDITATIRAVHRLKNESEHLTQTIDHLLINIEQYSEPDHGGE